MPSMAIARETMNFYTIQYNTIQKRPPTNRIQLQARIGNTGAYMYTPVPPTSMLVRQEDCGPCGCEAMTRHLIPGGL